MHDYTYEVVDICNEDYAVVLRDEPIWLVEYGVLAATGFLDLLWRLEVADEEEQACD
jgi:hypothetical protein